ncbi:hypothetical protein [Rubrivivax gelatinosus]|uniref:hypothetical protein n=1 Tax=Rubrivivax gelatinosus TaxID=28068 RepID=UPI001A919945|nr:hypothetical protein [Rubrivivax gelatinosus]
MVCMRSLRLRAVGMALACVLSACGGGGGGGEEPAPSSGLVPTAPTPGATLYTDATLLRPVADGASWTYRGTAEWAAMPTTIYQNVVSQARASDGTMVESATDIGHTGTGEQAVSASGGEVATISGFAVAYEPPTALRYLELRSPVRVGDQYTTLDLHRKDSGYDADGDGRNDAVDYAIYSRVIGTETVDLVHAPGVKTVRVRTTQAVRYTLSYSGQQTEVVSATTDLWYAEGVGIVKRVDDYPSSVAETGRDVTTEELVVFDGVAKGLGPMAKTALTTAGGQRVQEFRAAVGFGDHVLLMTMLQAGQDAGVTVHKLDARGQWLSGHDVAGFPNSDAQLVRLGERVLALAHDDAGIVMQAFDAEGVPAGSGVRLVSGSLTRLAGAWWYGAAVSRDTLWVVWEEQVGGTFGTYSLRAQPFDAAGRALAAASTLTEGQSTANSISGLSATGRSSGAALVTWSEFSDGQGYLRYAVLDGQSAPDVHGIGPISFTASLKPAVVSSGSALLWVSPSRGGALSGVTLSQDGSILTTPGKSLLEEVLPVEWWSRTDGFVLSGDQTIDIVAQEQNAKLWPEDFPRALQTLTELKPGAGSLAATGTVRLLARGIDSWPTALVELDGRILMIIWESAGLSTQVVWRRP